LNGGCGPKAATTTVALTRGKSSVPPAGDIPAQLRRRAVAAAGMHPLPGRSGDGLAARDPLLDWPPDRFEFGVETRRLAWLHLRDSGLMSEPVDRLLRGGVPR